MLKPANGFVNSVYPTPIKKPNRHRRLQYLNRCCGMSGNLATLAFRLYRRIQNLPNVKPSHRHLNVGKHAPLYIGINEQPNNRTNRSSLFKPCFTFESTTFFSSCSNSSCLISLPSIVISVGVTFTEILSGSRCTNDARKPAIRSKKVVI